MKLETCNLDQPILSMDKDTIGTQIASNLTENKRILQLDGLRGIAILIVILFHYLNNQYIATGAAHLNGVEKFFKKITSLGWSGVNLFFILSGYLIGSILLKYRTSPNYLKVFYTRRFFRIVPIYYFLLIVFIVLTHSRIYDPNAYIFEKPIPLGHYFLFVQNFYMSFHGHFGPEALTPTWSLAVEEQFYLIMPLVVYFLKNKSLKYFIIFGLILGPISRYFSANWYAEYTLLSSRIDSPLLGFLLAYWLQNESSVIFLRKNIFFIKITAMILVAICTFLYSFTPIGFMNQTIIGIIFAVIVLSALQLKKGFFYKILTWKPLLQLGKYSYCIYLFHLLVNGVLHLVILGQQTPKLDSSLAYLVTALALFSTYGFAVLSYRFFEGPLIKLGHSYKYQQFELIQKDL